MNVKSRVWERVDVCCIKLFSLDDVLTVVLALCLRLGCHHCGSVVENKMFLVITFNEHKRKTLSSSTKLH